ncbi:hypothetical protein [Seonamhaeicola sp. S2-3]|nr:hypothetical protein [Seonamhaeicola sp. S2-3]
MKKEHLTILLIISLIITAFGIITGRYFFLFLLIPFGFNWFKKGNKED